MIVIVDYGLGNLGSIANMCKRLGVEALVSSTRNDIDKARGLILPGVGHFDEGVKNLVARDLPAALAERVLGQGIPILGICLGAQLMTKGSHEGSQPGLGWLDADTVRFDSERFERPAKIPHMGWTDVTVEKSTPLFAHGPPEPRYYFVHSYHFRCHVEDDITASSLYGYRFTSAFQKANIHGVQFHPEKSHKYGLALMKGFCESL